MRGEPRIFPATSDPAATAESEEPTGAVAEVQGVYGPFAFPEKLLQKIWGQRDFAAGPLHTIEGRKVSVIHPGRWNGLGGPDFKAARLRFDDGGEFSCDVELHLHAGDWAVHGHASDRAYDAVRLHVVLFPPAAGHVTRAFDGQPIPVLVLLPFLLHDLEEYAAEAAVERLANRPAAAIGEILGALSPDEVTDVIARQAESRWRQKVHFARLRVQRLGWEDACHQTALEILGYRFNRAPMLRVAAAQPLSRWTAEQLSPEEIFAAERPAWSLAGVRPANHPRHRLAQYAAWVRARPDWPARLAQMPIPAIAAGETMSTRSARRAGDFGRLRTAWQREICGEAVGGTRFDNLVCDGFLPLLAVHGGAGRDAATIWRHWPPGDLPAWVMQALRQLGVFAGRERPACHGAAQGLLGWLIEREQRPADPARGP